MQVQVSKGVADGTASKASTSASAMVSSLMSLKASPTLVAAFLRTQPGTPPYALADTASTTHPLWQLRLYMLLKYCMSRIDVRLPDVVWLCARRLYTKYASGGLALGMPVLSACIA